MNIFYDILLNLVTHLYFKGLDRYLIIEVFDLIVEALDENSKGFTSFLLKRQETDQAPGQCSVNE